MRSSIRTFLVAIAASFAAITLGGARDALAHCDTMDGPVVQAGQKALATGELDYALVWIRAESEPELRTAFQHAVAVRKLTPEARELADRYFLETLVRLHRAGEGEPYTGLKPAGTDASPAIRAADRAVQTGSVRGARELVTDAVGAGLNQRFAKVMATRGYRVHDVAAGREYVAAYVVFIHHVERLYEAATSLHGHADASHDAH